MARRQRSFKSNPAAASRGGKHVAPATLSEPPLGDAARDAAIRALARQARGYPDFIPDALEQQIHARRAADRGALSPLDLGLAHAIYTSAINRWLTLAYLLHREIRQGFDNLEPRVRAALLAGAAQILFLDRIPAYAAINHAAEWAKLAVRPGAAGLVNAILRRIAELKDSATEADGPWADRRDALPLSSGRILVSSRLDLPSDPLDLLAIATSHPRLLLEHWSRSRPPAAVRDLALHTLTEPPIILNTEHAATGAHADNTGPHAAPHHLVYTGSAADLGPLLTSSSTWVQDPASAGAIRSIADLSPGLIVDLCAGQGTKTRQLAAAFPGADIIATDVDAARFAALQNAFASVERVRALPYDRAREAALGRADLILLDVPCSNTGVLPRRPEARYRFGPDTLESLAATQRQIIADSIPLLAPRGRILYSTCSLEPEENRAQAAWAGKWHGLAASRERTLDPAGPPGGDAASYHDGAYSVLLSRDGSK